MCVSGCYWVDLYTAACKLCKALYKKCCKCPGSGGNGLIRPCRRYRGQMDKHNFGKADRFSDGRVCFTQSCDTSASASDSSSTSSKIFI